MAWHRTGDKPLSEPMLNQFTDAYMRRQEEMVFNDGVLGETVGSTTHRGRNDNTELCDILILGVHIVLVQISHQGTFY